MLTVSIEETHGRLRFELTENLQTGRALVKCWRGKAKNPFAFYSFRDDKNRRHWIEEQKSADDASQKARAERDFEQHGAKLSMRARMPVGSLLVSTWGYDQTNVDYYEVVKRTAACAWIRPIESEIVRATGDMSEIVKPCPGKYTGEAQRKLITGFGVSMNSYSSARPTSPEETHEASHYA